MPDRAEVLRNALSLDVQDKAALAQKLLASLEELSEEEADRLWAEEAQRRFDNVNETSNDGAADERRSNKRFRAYRRSSAFIGGYQILSGTRH